MTIAARIALSASLVAAALTVSAQAGPYEPDALAAAQELTQEFFAGGTVEQAVATSWPRIDKDIRRSSPDADPVTIAELKADYLRLASAMMTDVLADFPALYAKHFTTGELRELLAFYRSPVGRKSVDLMPTLMREGMALAVARTPAFQRKLDQAFRARLAEKGVSLPI